MIEEIRIDNFLTWINTSFKPKQQNLIIGPNNSGKTNLCKAIRFLSFTTTQTIDDCAKFVAVPIWAIRNLSFSKPTIDFYLRVNLYTNNETETYEYKIVLATKSSPINQLGSAFEIELEELSYSDNINKNILLLSNTKDAVKLLHERDYFLKHNERYIETTAPRDRTMLNRLYDLESNERANRFKNYLTSWQYYFLSYARLTETTYYSGNSILFPDGGNLGSVIYQMKLADEKSYRELLEIMKTIEPNLEYINFQGGDKEQHIFMYFQYKSGGSLPAIGVSSGTLRYLALAYILKRQRRTDFLPLIMIEEPENGIYVQYLKSLIRLATTGEYIPQVIFTTHSPYFIDLFDQYLEGVFITNQDEYHSTIRNINAGDANNILNDFSLGEAFFRNILK